MYLGTTQTSESPILFFEAFDVFLHILPGRECQNNTSNATNSYENVSMHDAQKETDQQRSGTTREI